MAEWNLPYNPTLFNMRVSGDDSAIVLLYPTWDFQQRMNRIKKYKRTQGGTLHTYSLVGSWIDFTIPVTQINSSSMSLVSSWWENSLPVHLSILGTGHVYSFYGELININNPVDSFVEVNPSLFNGTLYFHVNSHTGT